jgi:hypothetical protein
MANTGSVVSRVYSGFRGADFRGDDINLMRSPNCKNVWRDYKEIESIRTRPTMKLMAEYTDVHNIYFYDGSMLVHSGTSLYKDGITQPIYSGLQNRKSNGFIYGTKFYLMDGAKYLVYDGTTIKDVEGYVPTTSIGKKPLGGGTMHEDINMLSDYRINTFVADGTTEYYVDAQNIDAIVEIRVDDVKRTDYTVNLAEGKITFTSAPTEPQTAGQDNVWIKYKKTVVDKNGTEADTSDDKYYKDSILKCTICQVFDNRVFYSGNPDFPNYVWHCSLDDPSYVSDKDFYEEGKDSAKVVGMVAGNNALWVFREPSDANTNVFYHVPSLDDEYGKIYPSSHSSIALGCEGKAINFNDDIAFFSVRGMEGISSDIATEQFVAHRSTMVDRLLTAEDNYKDMILEEWEGYLLVIIGNKCYLADSRGIFTNENHVEYEWFYWEFTKAITCTKVHDGVLYLGTEDGVYTLTGTTDEDIPEGFECYWETPKDKFKVPHKLKTTNKKGCVIEATGTFEVLAKTDDETEFTSVYSFEDIKDYCVCRIKKKKFKDLQLKFYSTKVFSLEQATLEAIIGGYIKGR